MSVDALRTPFYSSWHPDGSDVWGNPFDVANAQGLFLESVPISVGSKQVVSLSAPGTYAEVPAMFVGIVTRVPI